MKTLKTKLNNLMIKSKKQTIKLSQIEAQISDICEDYNSRHIEAVCETEPVLLVENGYNLICKLSEHKRITVCFEFTKTRVELGDIPLKEFPARILDIKIN